MTQEELGKIVAEMSEQQQNIFYEKLAAEGLTEDDLMLIKKAAFMYKYLNNEEFRKNAVKYACEMVLAAI